MAKLQLTFASGLYDRMQPLYTGEVQPDGIDLNFIAIDQPRPIFDRMSAGQEFDVAEYSSSEFVQRFANKQCPFVAIPVFPSRAFRHGFIAIHKKAGITQAEGPRRQARRRAAVHHDGGDLHQRHPAARIRRRPAQGAVGAGRHEHRRRARQPDRAAAAQAVPDRAEPLQQVDERSAGGAHRWTPRSAPACRRRS